MKKIILISISILVFSIFVFAFTIFASNNNVANNVAKRLEDIPLPENTQYIENVSRAGKMVGNGNGMQYFGAILIKSELPLEQLKNHYSNFAENEWDCIVENQLNNSIQAIESGDLEFKSEISSDNYFIVYSWGSNKNVFADFDIRGH